MSQSPTRSVETSDCSRTAAAIPVIEEQPPSQSQSQQPPAPAEPAATAATADFEAAVPAPCDAPSVTDDAAAQTTASGCAGDAGTVGEAEAEPKPACAGADDAPSAVVGEESAAGCADGAAVATTSDDQERPGGADAVRVDEREDDSRAHEAAATPVATAAVDSGLADDAPSAKKHRAEACSPRLAAAAEPAIGV